MKVKHVFVIFKFFERSAVMIKMLFQKLVTLTRDSKCMQFHGNKNGFVLSYRDTISTPNISCKQVQYKMISFKAPDSSQINVDISFHTIWHRPAALNPDLCTQVLVQTFNGFPMR